jgi:hypothetical protein
MLDLLRNMNCGTFVITLLGIGYLAEYLIDGWRASRPSTPYVPPPQPPRPWNGRNAEGSGYEDIAMRDKDVDDE